VSDMQIADGWSAIQSNRTGQRADQCLDESEQI
jgi:hypothetical protein